MRARREEEPNRRRLGWQRAVLPSGFETSDKTLDDFDRLLTALVAADASVG